MSGDIENDFDSSDRLLYEKDLETDVHGDADDIPGARERLLEQSEKEKRSSGDEIHVECSDEESVQQMLRALVDDENRKDLIRNKDIGTDISQESPSDTIEKQGLRTGATGSETKNVSSASFADIKKVKLHLEVSSDASTLHVPQTTAKRPMSAVALERRQRAQKLLQKHNSQKGKIICGIYCIIFILAIGVGMLFLAYLLGMNDLYIVGVVFSVGGVVFALGFVFVRCCIKYDDVDYSSLYVDKV
ncbi:uncharacterized protein LOC128219106 [Mya arenaria]|uniref:uncharacterized protein LOC128219106 n=1 Tax=Mya arenaria TaxID=6604 RepID=UPI0022E43735|nr:uncharacterized protein LOC128219106 [Mya arenaria]